MSLHIVSNVCGGELKVIFDKYQNIPGVCYLANVGGTGGVLVLVGCLAVRGSMVGILVIGS